MAENASQSIEHPLASGGRPPLMPNTVPAVSCPFPVWAPVKFRAGSAPDVPSFSDLRFKIV